MPNARARSGGRVGDGPARDEPGMAAADLEPTRRGQGEVTIE